MIIPARGKEEKKYTNAETRVNRAPRLPSLCFGVTICEEQPPLRPPSQAMDRLAC